MTFLPASRRTETDKRTSFISNWFIAGNLSQYLMAFEGVQDGELARVFQGEDDDFACVVKPWSSCHEQTALFG